MFGQAALGNPTSSVAEIMRNLWVSRPAFAASILATQLECPLMLRDSVGTAL